MPETGIDISRYGEYPLPPFCCPFLPALAKRVAIAMKNSNFRYSLTLSEFPPTDYFVLTDQKAFRLQ